MGTRERAPACFSYLHKCFVQELEKPREITGEGNEVEIQSEGQVLKLVWEMGRLRCLLDNHVEKMSWYQDILEWGLRGTV